MAAAAGAARRDDRLSLTRSLRAVQRLAGQQQVTLFEDVVGVELGDRGDLHALDVPGTAVEDRVVRGQADQDGAAVEGPVAGLGLGLADGLGRLGLGQVGTADRLQGTGRRLLGLGGLLAEARPSSDQRLPVLELRQQGHADRGPDGLLGHRVAIVAVAAGEGDAAPFPLVGPLRAGTGVAGSLLAEEFLARAGDVGPAAGVDGANPPRGLVHQHHVVEQLLVDRAAEIGRVDRFFAHLFAGGVVNGYGQHVRSIRFQS